MLGEIASEKEVQLYMKNLQKQMKESDQVQFGKQENAQSNIIVNMKNYQEFDVKEASDVINEVNQIQKKYRGKVMHEEIEGELDLEDDDGFDLGDEMEEQEGSDKDIEDYEEFTGHQKEEEKKEDQ